MNLPRFKNSHLMREKRWTGREEDFSYPPYGCASNVNCKMCPLFTCGRCKKKRPWCIGADGPHPSWCDLCWSAYHTKGKVCGTCTRFDRRSEMSTLVARIQEKARLKEKRN